MTIFSRFSMLPFALLFFIQGQSFAGECCWSSLPIAGEINIAYDEFRGIPDGTWNGNTGGLVGANFAVGVFDLFGIQIGGSYGVYDWYGRGAVGPGSACAVQQQGFVTAGFFRETLCPSGFQGALVLDWMFNENFGVFALNPSFGQLRLEVGYLLNATHEFGLWGTLDVHTSHKSSFQIPISYRAISQVNLFWRYFFENCAEAMVWAGAPYKKGLMFPGKRAGQYILGAALRAPLTANLNLEAHGAYMGPMQHCTSRHFQNYDANICIGVSYTFGLGEDVCCETRQVRPYLSIANNSNFFVETNLSN